MPIDLNELTETSALSKELAWLESALDMNDTDERKHFVLCEELFGKRVMVATDRTRLHISTRYAHCFPVGWIPKADEYLPPNRYYRYEDVTETCTGTKVTFNRELLENILKRLQPKLSPADDKKAFSMTFEKQDKVSLSVYSSTHGKVEFEMPCSSSKRPDNLKITLPYFMDAIAGCDSKTIVLQQNREKDGAICLQLGQGRVAFLKPWPTVSTTQFQSIRSK